MTQEERKVGHNALRFKDGKIEHFDPHPQETKEQDEKEFEEWLKDTLNNQTVNLMPKAVWLASRRLMREKEAKDLKSDLQDWDSLDLKPKQGDKLRGE